MKSIQQWTSIICIASIICIIIELMLPPGKMEKTMRMVLGIFMVCALISPIKNLKKLNFNISNITTEAIKDKFEFTNKINSQLTNLAEDNVRVLILSILKEKGISPKKVDIFMDTNEDNCISIIKSKIYVSKEEAELVNNIKSLIESKLKIETEVVLI